jgi:hypothetical protein
MLNMSKLSDPILNRNRSRDLDVENDTISKSMYPSAPDFSNTVTFFFFGECIRDFRDIFYKQIQLITLRVYNHIYLVFLPSKI